MKKKVFIYISMVIFILSGCTSNMIGDTGSSNNSPTAAIVSTVERPFAIEHDDSGQIPFNAAAVCYSDEDVLILSNVNQDRIINETRVPPEIRTDGVYKIYTDSGEYQYYDIKCADEIYRAVPYEDGIIYSYYTPADEKDQTDTIACRWEIVYYDGENNHVLDSGFCYGGQAPQLALIENTPVYSCENNKEESFGATVRKIENMQPVTIKDFPGYEHLSILSTNGKDYCFELYEPTTNKRVICVGNLEKVYHEREITDVCNSYGITNNYVVCSIGSETNEIKILGIPLDGKADISFDQIKRWYRITGGTGDYCLAVDSGFNLYYIDVENQAVEQVPISDEYRTEWELKSKGISSAGKNKFILCIYEDNFYKLTL